MEPVILLIGLGFSALYGWLALPGMWKNKHYPDLAVNLLLLTGVITWLVLVSFNSTLLNPATFIGQLFAPLIRRVYGPWT